MLTEKSSIKQLIKNPIGSDLVNSLLTQTGMPEELVNNPLCGNLPISVIGKALGGEMVQSILHLVNSEKDSPPKPPKTITPAWWKEAVVYQVYPRSFADSNGDGLGDINGITQKLPYLKELGIDVLWLSPIYDSPNDDNGYDIRDYRLICPDFGTMEDFDTLLNSAHSMGIRVIMDLVVNHTSDEHEWFKKAKEGDEEKSDYYIFKNGSPNTPPNNWLSFFSGSAWQWCSEKEQWYLHIFSKKQPDLNWENPNMRAEIYDMMNWWYDKGIDGFRMDVINFISKSTFANGSEALGKVTGYRGIEHYFYGPNLHRHLHEMRMETTQGRNVFTVGETPAIGMQMCKLLTAETRGELDMVFNFEHFENPAKNRFDDYEYNLNYLKKYYINWQQNYGNNCWQTLVIENHDNPRITSKVSKNPKMREPIAKLIATIMLTLKGTPYIYQGQELGLDNVDFKDINQMQDVESINLYNELCKTMPKAEAFAKVLAGSRDHARAPMVWSTDENAGFSTALPWLRLPNNWQTLCVETQRVYPNSVFNFYKSLIALRKSEKALVYGEFSPVFEKTKDIFCYFRVLNGVKFYIECNLSDKILQRPAKLYDNLSPVLSSYETKSNYLRAYETNIYKVINIY